MFYIYIFLGLIILVNIGCIVYLVIKERKRDREEIDEIVTSLASAKPREVKEVKEEKPEVKEEKIEEKEDSLEIEKVLEQMQKDLEVTPEEVVSTFEQEQEENSIISYQELVKTLKKEKPIKEEIKKEITDSFLKENVDVIDIEDDLVVKKVESVPLFEEEIIEPKNEVEEEFDEDEFEEAESLEEVEEVEKTKEEKKKFKNTDIISPIFGKIEENADYPTVPKITREEKLDALFEDSQEGKQARKALDLEQTLNMEPLKEEIRKNDEFLRALKDFRSNL